MVAVSHREADRFISGGAPATDVYLVFGTDSGLVSERTRAIVSSFGVDPSNHDQTTRLEGDELAASPGMLFEEAHAIGLFASRRAIIVRLGSRQITASVEALLDEPAQDCKVVIQGGALRRDAPIRALMTRAKNAAAIECYPDQAADVGRLIDSEIRNAGMTIDNQAREILIALLGDDRLSTRSEIEKLVLYCWQTKYVSAEDVFEAVADASASALDDIIQAAFSGNLSYFGSNSNFIYASTSEASALLAFAMRHAFLLHQIRIDIDAGGDTTGVIDRYTGRTFFGPRKEALTAQVRLWTAETLHAVIELLNATILAQRVESSLSNSIAMQLLLTVARRAMVLRQRGRAR